MSRADRVIHVIHRVFSCLLLLTALTACGARAATAPVSRSGPVDDHAFDYDASAPLDFRVEESGKKDGLTVQTISYASPKGGRVPAALLVPDGPGPFAGMLLMHGAPGTYKGMLPEGEDLARRGAVVLLINAPFSRPGFPSGGFLTFTPQDRASQVQLIVDLRRGVDLLTARPDVDKKRLGYLGISYGGAMGGLLAGAEKRIKAYALVVGDGGLVSHFTGTDDARGPLQRMPPEERKRWRDAMEPIEPLRWVGRAAPAHLLFQNGREDNLVPPADGKAYQHAGSEPKKTQWYDAGHGLDEQARHDRHEWLAREIGIAKP
jgi:dienelactone hydrolase